MLLLCNSLSCDRNCSNRQTKISEHILAVTCRRGTLDQFLAWFKRGCRGAKLLDLALQGGPKNAGRKPSNRKRSNAKRTTTDVYVDMLDGNTIQSEQEKAA